MIARRRGFTLLHLLAMLPLALIAGSSLAVLLGRCLETQRRAVDLVGNDAIGGTFRAAWRADVERAKSAALDRDDNGALVLEYADGAVRYRVGAARVMRIVSGDTTESHQDAAWALRHGQASFAIEHIEGGGVVVWLTLSYAFPQHGHSPYVERVVVAASLPEPQP